MSLFQKRGLLRDNRLSDVANKKEAVNNILRLFADNDSSALSLDDLNPLIGISDISTFDAKKAFERIGNDTSFDVEDSELGYSIETFKNKMDNVGSYIKTPIYNGGNGLTGRFYKLSSLPDDFIDALNNSSPLNIFGEDSPSFSIEDLIDIPAVTGPRGDLFHDGDMTFTTDSFFDNISDVRLALFTGYIRFTNNDSDIPNSISKFTETMSGITFNYNANEITNVVSKIILEDVNTGERVVDFTFEPDDAGHDNLLGTNNAFLPETRYAKKYELFKISIVYIITDDILERFSGDVKKVTIDLRNRYNNDIADRLSRTYLYQEDYLDESPLEKNIIEESTKNKALIKYGSSLNVSTYKDIYNEIGAFDYYNDIIFSNKITLSYKPKEGDYTAIENASFVDSQYTLGDSHIRTTQNIDDVELGNYVHGIQSAIGDPIYVTGKSERDKVLLLSEEPVYLDTSSPIDTDIQIIDHNGLVNIGTYAPEPLEGITGDYVTNLSFGPSGSKDTWYTCEDQITISSGVSWEAEVDMVISQWQSTGYIHPFRASTYNNFGGYIGSGVMTLKSRGGTLSYNLITAGVTLGEPFTLRWGYQESPSPRLFIHVSPSGGNPTIQYSYNPGDQSSSYTDDWHILKGVSADSVYGIKSAKLTVDGEVVLDYQQLTRAETITDSASPSNDLVLDGSGGTGDLEDIAFLDYVSSPPTTSTTSFFSAPYGFTSIYPDIDSTGNYVSTLYNSESDDKPYYIMGDDISIPDDTSWFFEADVVIHSLPESASGYHYLLSAVAGGVGSPAHVYLDSAAPHRIFLRSRGESTHITFTDAGIEYGVPFNLKAGHNDTLNQNEIWINGQLKGSESGQGGNTGYDTAREFRMFYSYNNQEGFWGMKSVKLTVGNDVIRDYSQLAPTQYISDLSANNQDAYLHEDFDLSNVGYLDYLSSPVSISKTPSLFRKLPLKAGDFVYLPDFNSSNVKYNRIKTIDPFTIEEIATNNTVTDITDLLPENQLIYVYKQSAIDNQVLDDYCILDDSSPFQGDLIKLEVTSNVSSGDTIEVSDSVINYVGNAIAAADSPSPLVGKYVVFDGDDINNVIPADTTITNVLDNGDGTLNITISNDVDQLLLAGSILTVADDFNTANVKYKCFPPTDPSAPFIADGEDIRLDSAAGRDAVDFTTGTNHTVEFSFNGLKLDDSSSPSIIQSHSGDAPFDNILKIKDAEDNVYEIPLTIV